MSDMNAVFMALAVLEQQSRAQAAEIAELKKLVRMHDERLNAHGMLLTQPSRRDVVRHYEAQLAQIKPPARREFLSGGVTYYLPPEVT